jgi:hypothetical protein
VNGGNPNNNDNSPTGNKYFPIKANKRLDKGGLQFCPNGTGKPVLNINSAKNNSTMIADSLNNYEKIRNSLGGMDAIRHRVYSNDKKWKCSGVRARKKESLSSKKLHE